nr:TolC family protein [Pseudomonadota bacterium]
VVIVNRPDIREAERKLAAATAQQGVAVAKFFPDLSLTGFFGLLNTNAGQLLTTASKSWAAGGQVLWPILSYGALSANLDAANAQQQEAMAAYQKTIMAALSDVERSVTAYTKQQEYAETLEKAVADTRHAAAISRQRYKEGLTSFLEVLDAERTLYASESQMTAAEAATAQDLVAVYKSLGGGWRQAPGPEVNAHVSG